MGDLILMPRPARPARTAANAEGHSAEILFFTGVRYYRMPDALPAQPKTPRRRRQAARIETPRLDCHA